MVGPSERHQNIQSIESWRRKLWLATLESYPPCALRHRLPNRPAEIGRDAESGGGYPGLGIRRETRGSWKYELLND